MKTAKEMAFEVAMLFINGTNTEKQKILSCFEGEEREVFLRGVCTIRLFCDQNYYDTVKKRFATWCATNCIINHTPPAPEVTRAERKIL